jgi:hypothetical protein
MLPISLLNGAIGSICGLRFRFQILVPLIAIVMIEVALLKHGGMWSSKFWSTVELMAALEVGYLIGSAAGAYRSYWNREKLSEILHNVGKATFHIVD